MSNLSIQSKANTSVNTVSTNKDKSNMPNVSVKALAAQVETLYTGDKSPLQAAREAESDLLSQFRQQRNDTLDAIAVRVTRAIHEKDRSHVMKLFHASANALNATADQYNGVLEEFAARAATKFRKWTPKTQHALTQAVRMGEATKMQHGDVEYLGFDGDKVLPYLMTWDKEKWAKRANNVVYNQIADMVIALINEADGNEIASEAVVLSPAAIKYQYGRLHGKVMFRVIGSIATRAALFEKYVTVDTNGEYTTRTIERMKDSIARREGDIGYASSNHYVEEAAEELRAKLTQLESWVFAHNVWQQFKPLVEEYNRNTELMDEANRYPLPTGDLQEMAERQYKGLMEVLTTDNHMTVGMAEFQDKLATAAKDAAAALDALLK